MGFRRFFCRAPIGTYFQRVQVPKPSDSGNACGNLSGTEDALGNTVLYEYNVTNYQIGECMDGSGEQVCATLDQYDRKGWMIRVILPSLEEKVYNYAVNDNKVSFTDEEGQEKVPGLGESQGFSGASIGSDTK